MTYHELIIDLNEAAYAALRASGKQHAAQRPLLKEICWRTDKIVDDFNTDK